MKNRSMMILRPFICHAATFQRVRNHNKAQLCCQKLLLLNARLHCTVTKMTKIYSRSTYFHLFWSVSWSTNCPVYLSFFWLTKEKFVQYQIFFVHSLEFFVQSFLKMWFWSVSWLTNCPVNFSFFEKDWTKNSRERTKKIWDCTNFFWSTKKNEK